MLVICSTECSHLDKEGKVLPLSIVRDNFFTPGPSILVLHNGTNDTVGYHCNDEPVSKILEVITEV